MNNQAAVNRVAKRAGGAQEVEYVEQKFSSSFRYYVQNSYVEIKRRPCYYCLALMSVTIVVLAAAVSQSLIDRAPVIFLKNAESTGGEIDIEISPNEDLFTPSQDFYPFLNSTRVEELTAPLVDQRPSPRIEYYGMLFSTDNSESCLLSRDTPDALLYNYAQASLSCSQTMITMHAIDSDTEKQMGLGREYPFSALGAEQCVLHKKLAETLGVRVGDEIYFGVNVRQHMLAAYAYLCSQRTYPFCVGNTYVQDDPGTIVMRFTIADTFDAPYGKMVSTDASTAMIVEYKYIFQNFARYFLASAQSIDLVQLFLNELSTLDPRAFATVAYINLPDRLNLYVSSNYDIVQSKVTKIASQVAVSLGVYPIVTDLPVLKNLYNTRFAAMFLGIILNIIIIVLLVLSILLLYNLLLVSVETKTFEMGVLRILGLNKLGVVSLIIVQSVFYVVPAVIIGLLLSVPALSMAGNALERVLSLRLPSTPTPGGVAYALGIGIVIPIASSIIPIRVALKQTLSDALDVNRSKSQAVKIDVDVEGKSFPWGRVSFALVSTLFGVSIYYFLPLSLLSFNFALLINIFFWILVGMLAGLILLALNVQYLLERLVVAVFYFWAGSATRSLILKNLAAHRLKNRRTAIMYALSIAFIIFVWTSVTIQVKSQQFETLQLEGSYMNVYYTQSSSGSSQDGSDDSSYSPVAGSPSSVSQTAQIPIKELEQLLSTSQVQSIVTDYAWLSDDLEATMNKAGYAQTYITHRGKLYQRYPRVTAVSPNFLRVAESDMFLKVIERAREDSQLDTVQELYTPRGSQSVIVPQKYAKDLRLRVDPDSSFFVLFFNERQSKRKEVRVSSVLKQAPVFSLLNDPIDIVVSFETFMRFAGEDVISTYTQLPMKRALLKLRDGATSQEMDSLYTYLSRNFQESGYAVSVWDFRDTQQQAQQTQQVTTIIFTVLTVIAMVLCFFSLISSMTANILEQTKEIAVLRAVGLTRSQMVRLYIYEAFTLVLSSCIVGIFVGTIVGLTMSMQRALFTQLPVPYGFPWQITLSVFLTSIVCAFASTYMPARNVLANQISQIIRMTG